VAVFGNGDLTIDSFEQARDVTIGSIEGDGNVFLGANILTVGSNHLSTLFSGVINDGGRISGQSGGSLTKIGPGTLILSGANIYTGATTINGGTLKVDGSITSAVMVNNGGLLAGSGTTYNVTVNSGGTVAPGGSETLHINGNYVQNAGGVLKIEAESHDPNASGRLDVTGSATIDGTLEIRFENGFLPINGQVIEVLHVDGAFSGSFAQIIFPDLRAGFQFQAEFVNGTYKITALNDGVAATGFLNISTRMLVGTGDNALIGGFIVTGTAPKKVILRAIGPSLAPLSGRLDDPTLELRDSAGALLSSNDNWVESSQVQEIIDSTIPPNDDLDAAIVATLAPGSYTAIMRGANNSTGLGVVEVYDLATNVPARLANISSRGFVETGDNAMIGGFIAGNQATHVIVRALGPSLTQAGVPNALANPNLSLHDAQGAIIAFNDDWQETTNQAAIEATGIPPTDDKESAILATLAPGNYTAIVRGLNDTTGVGLVEVYHLH
jgi:autotransporter-associated beta strand protein